LPINPKISAALDLTCLAAKKSGLVIPGLDPTLSGTFLIADGARSFASRLARNLAGPAAACFYGFGQVGPGDDGNMFSLQL